MIVSRVANRFSIEDCWFIDVLSFQRGFFFKSMNLTCTNCIVAGIDLQITCSGIFNTASKTVAKKTIFYFWNTKNRRRQNKIL